MEYLDNLLLVSRKSSESLTVIKVSPGVVSFDDEVLVVEHSEPVSDVSAEVRVGVFREELAGTLTIPRPVSEVADHLVVA